MLVGADLEAFVRRLKVEVDGVIAVAGPDLAASLTDLGLIDEYHLYFRPFVFGRGKPFFAGTRTPLRLVGTKRVGEDAIKLTFVPARMCQRMPQTAMCVGVPIANGNALRRCRSALRRLFYW